MDTTSLAYRAMLPPMLVPLLVAALCTVAALQLRSRAMRLLAVASLVTGLCLPWLAFSTAAPVRLAAIAGSLLAFSLYWLAIADLVGQRRSLRWVAAAPLAWLGFCLARWLSSGLPTAWYGLPPGDMLADMVFAFVLDDLLALACLAALLRVRHRSLAHQCMIGLVALHPLMTCLSGISLVWPHVPMVGARTELMLMVAVFSRTILWPGLAMITALDMETRRERRLALRDELSRLLNRRGFWRKAEAMPERTLVLFDIDHFKRINDTLGHAAGDATIQRFAQILRHILGGDAVLGRVGGEEFAAALCGQDRLEIRTRAEQVRTAFADSEQALGCGTTVSVGIAIARGGVVNLSDQMALADRALYRAKRLGRNRVVMEDALSETATDRTRPGTL